MKQNKIGTSIVEAMIVLMIVTLGITSLYGVLHRGQTLQTTTSKRIEAIQIARDGLEAFTNIRNTNWLLFSADFNNCWNTLNYDATCIGNNLLTTDIQHGGNQGIKIYSTPENRYEIQIIGNSGDYLDSTYRNNFAVGKDSNGFYTQTGANSGEINFYGVNGIPYYTREIQLVYITATGAEMTGANSNQPMVKVSSIVQWQDNSKTTPYTLELSTILSNWKAVY